MVRSSEQIRELTREGLTMALYVSLSLLAVMLAVPDPRDGHEGPDPALLLLVASVGLIAAHAVAFRVSARLIGRGEVDEDSAAILAAQLLGGGLVTVIAVLPVAIVRGETGLRLSEVSLMAFVAVVGWTAVRVSGSASRGRALAYVLGLLLAAGAVLVIKQLAGH